MLSNIHQLLASADGRYNENPHCLDETHAKKMQASSAFAHRRNHSLSPVAAAQ
jgi:hypothetical protein